MLVDCKKYITDIDMAMVHNDGKFMMLMPDGRFLEVLIYRRYVRAIFLEDFEERFGVSYLLQMINGDQLKITLMWESDDALELIKSEKLITDIKYLKEKK